MSTIVTRSGKGSPLTNTEVDSNFTNLNSDKLEKSGGTMTGNLGVSSSGTIGLTTTYSNIKSNAYLYVDDGSNALGFDSNEITGSTDLYLASGNNNIVLASDARFTATGTQFNNTSVNNWNTAYGWGNHASAGYQDGTYVDGIAYENSATLNRSVGDGQQWVKICDLGTGQPQRIYLKITHTGDNTNCEFEAEVSIAGYGFVKHIIVKNPQRYNAPRVSFIRVHQASSGDVEVWLQVEDLTSANGSLIVRSNKAIPTLTATSTEPTWSTSETVYINDTALNYDVLPSNGILFQDNVKASFGTNQDLQIFHSGSHSYIKDGGTGNLVINANDFKLKNANDTEMMIDARQDGSVYLYHNNSERLSTSSNGVDITGRFTTTSRTWRFETDSWTYGSHDLVNGGWYSSLSDYIYLKAAGNSDSGHGAVLVADNGIYFGRMNQETGTGSVSNSATAPLDGGNWGYVNSTAIISKNDLVVEGGEISMGPTTDSNRLRLIEDTQQTNEVLKVQNDVGYVRIGPQNTGYNHFVTDRSANYFNTRIEIDTGEIRAYDEDFNINRAGSSTARIRITDGETHSDQDFTVSGLLSATTKSFVIDHPTKDGFKLRHGSLEGAENGVYVRGRAKSNIIELPDYWSGLVDEDSVTINITPIGRDQGIYVESWDNQRVVLAGTAIDCFYTIYGERKDVDPFEVEYEE